MAGYAKAEVLRLGVGAGTHVDYPGELPSRTGLSAVAAVVVGRHVQQEVVAVAVAAVAAAAVVVAVVVVEAAAVVVVAAAAEHAPCCGPHGLGLVPVPALALEWGEGLPGEGHVRAKNKEPGEEGLEGQEEQLESGFARGVLREPGLILVSFVPG